MNNSSVEFPPITTTTSIPPRPSSVQEIISDEEYVTIQKVLVFGQFFFSCLGVVTNSLNIRVFLKQGLTTSSTNVGLFFLSVFDFFACLLLLAPEICVAFEFMDDVSKKRYCYAYTAYNIFIYVIFYDCSNLTTVYLSVERFLCVMMPLKVKSILKPKVTVIIIVIFSAIFLTGQMFYITSTETVWFPDPRFNLSFPYVIETPFAKEFVYYYSLIGNAILFALAMFVVAITTFIMIQKLHKYQKWRQSNAVTTTTTNTSSAGDDAQADKKLMSSKDAEMVKTVTTVTCIYLVCLTAGHVPPAVVTAFPGATYTGINKNLFSTGYMTRFLFSLVNSSINFFFYVRISSRYKEAFTAVFPRLSRIFIDGNK